MAGPTPYAPRERYTNPYAGTLAELIGRSGQNQAEGIRRGGEISGQMYANLGNTISGTLGAMLKERQEAPIRKMQLDTAQLGLDAAKRTDLDASRQRSAGGAIETVLRSAAVTDPQTGVATYDRAKLQAGLAEVGIGQAEFAKYQPVLDASDAAIATVKKAHVEAIQNSARLVDLAGNDPTVFAAEIRRGIANKLFTEQEAQPYLDAAQRDPAHIATITAKMLGKDPNAGAYTLNPGDVRIGPNGQTLATNPKPEDGPKAGDYEWVSRGGKPIQITKGTAQPGDAPYQPPSQAQPPSPVAILGPDGLPVYVNPREALGHRPASTREQGRPVTSGDAGRISDFDNSLHQLTELRGTVSGVAGATGVKAKAGAMLPNAVTEVTGWGATAKSKQAVIDRVKQVIGKALEGGVLRKEDEYKYEKILPTIGDVAAVVTSKLDGLEQAITQKRADLLSSLGDANYDVTRYQQRTPTTSTIGRFHVTVEP